MDKAGLVSVSEGSHAGSTIFEDVKVCDICGHAGMEDMLAICSRCSDGAEHIYCMRTMLEKLPDADWICEDCVLSEEKDKRRQIKWHSGRRTRENADLVTIPSQNYPKHQLPVSSGLPAKSKSFNGSDRRPKVQFLEKHPEKQMFHSKTDVSTKGKACAFRSLKKSPSLSDARSGRSNALDVETRTSAPKLSEVSDLKRLRKVKECSSAKMEVKSVLKKPRILSPDGSFKFASSAGTGEVMKLSTKSNPSQELKPKGEVKSSSSLTSRRHFISSSGATGQDKLPFRKRPSYQNAKAPQGSDSRLKYGRMPDETESARSHKFETVDSTARKNHLEDSPAVSVIDTRREKVLKKSCGRDLASRLPYQLNINGSLAVPMFNYIWKGEFKIHSRGRLPGFLHKIQAHLSTQSSPKIPGVVKKFSGKVHLKEVSRLTAWPTQFLKYQAKDDSIGLYFFAQDIESYSKYRRFLHCMMHYDLALKGNVDGIELLIFPSNLLPEKSQRWNRLFFLWGVFKQT